MTSFNESAPITNVVRIGGFLGRSSTGLVIARKRTSGATPGDRKWLESTHVLQRTRGSAAFSGTKRQLRAATHQGALRQQI